MKRRNRNSNDVLLTEGTPGLVPSRRVSKGAKVRARRVLTSYTSVGDARRGGLRTLSSMVSRDLAVLPGEVQTLVDNRVKEVAPERLNITRRFLARNLIYRVPNWWGVQSVSTDALGDAGRAKVAFTPKTRGERFVRPMRRYTVPLPCTFSDFSFDIRTLESARRTGVPIETRHVDMAVRNNNEMTEDMIVFGGPAIHGNVINGLMNTTSTYTFAGGTPWTAKTGEDIVADVGNMIEAQRLNGFTGPQELLLPGNYFRKLSDDYKANSSDTILERLRRLQTVDGGTLEVTISDRIPANTTFMINAETSTMDLIYGQGPIAISWSDGAGLETYWFVVSCIVPRLFPNYNGKYGVLKGTPT